MTDASYAFLRPGHYARGWHILLFSQELAVGDVKPLRYFDHDFVIYRGESGRAAVLPGPWSLLRQGGWSSNQPPATGGRGCPLYFHDLGGSDGDQNTGGGAAWRALTTLPQID